MHNLFETYGGHQENPVIGASYFCYTIFDAEMNMYYSGSRGVRGRSTHDIGHTYFTSSSVTDFVSRFKKDPSSFRWHVEYFCSREAAFDAESAFHKKFNVGQHPNFYNVQIHGGSLCGAGSVLCIDDRGLSYRVSQNEYHQSPGLHRTSSVGKANARNIKTGEVKKIPIAQLGGDWISELSGIVVAVEKKTGTVQRMSKQKFDMNRDQFSGVTAGKAPMIDTETGQSRMVSAEERSQNPGRYIGISVGKTSVVDLHTGNKLTISSEERRAHPEKYKHFNLGKVTVFDIRDKMNKSVSAEEFERDKEYFSNSACPVYWEFDGTPVTSRERLNELFKHKYGRNLPRIRAAELWQADPLIKVIKK